MAAKGAISIEDIEVEYLPPIHDPKRFHEGIVEIINWINRHEQQNAEKPQA